MTENKASLQNDKQWWKPIIKLCNFLAAISILAAVLIHYGGLIVEVKALEQRVIASETQTAEMSKQIYELNGALRTVVADLSWIRKLFDKK